MRRSHNAIHRKTKTVQKSLRPYSRKPWASRDVDDLLFHCLFCSLYCCNSHSNAETMCDVRVFVPAFLHLSICLARTIGAGYDTECGLLCVHTTAFLLHDCISSATSFSLLRFSASALALDSRAAAATSSISACNISSVGSSVEVSRYRLWMSVIRLYFSCFRGKSRKIYWNKHLPLPQIKYFLT